MTYGQIWREIARLGWGVNIKAAHMLGSRRQPTIGLSVVLDAQAEELRAVVIHHEELADDGAVLAALLRLCREVDPEW